MYYISTQYSSTVTWTSEAREGLMGPEEPHTWCLHRPDSLSTGQPGEQGAGTAGGNHTQKTRHRRHKEELCSQNDPPPTCEGEREGTNHLSQLTYPIMLHSAPVTAAQMFTQLQGDTHMLTVHTSAWLLTGDWVTRSSHFYRVNKYQ